MSLHVEVTGQGEPLVMLHGWGMHGGVWSDAVARLAQAFEVHNVDLPGHGESGLPGAFTLEAVTGQLAAHFDQPFMLLGWSLGGIIAQHWAAREPRLIRRMVLVASTPCFTGREDWQCGMPQQTLEQFAAELGNNHAATLRRFLALQVRGSEGERELLGLLRERLFSRGEPHLDALRGGLQILRDADLREVLPRIAQPTLVLAGGRDKLTPPQASHHLAQQMPCARVVEIEGAAHAPFLSHPEIFVEQVCGFLNIN
ncbi:pimeloyl-[acyl-carrier protein] methyl ester esterase [Sideroxyarcus emersonii]|uniref:Pimeloyl-[acyl-carrier protein] methyl ester esterase n=1 Tax=Sideroxyarcus emersonii TaxID=2764705 RepID=A0AAN2BZT8_9PROT|nr:pimeloyl-ACP methyl ester esterase BioH [Sideroxyarcus emersonii]BCK88554.1 pimeloyl-[acyl-carrier protein] methyl ester esterase [Sideroxyarcus emersonii]